MDHFAKVARKAAQIADREHEVDQAPREKERATRGVSAAEQRRAHLQTQRDRELKVGRKATG